MKEAIYIGVVVTLTGAVGTSAATAYIKNEAQDIKIRHIEKTIDKDREQLLSLIKESREDIKKILINQQEGK